MKADNLIKVLWDDCLVGTLAMTQDQRVAFQYSDEWLEREMLEEYVNIQASHM